MVGVGKLVTTEDIMKQLTFTLLESVGEQGGLEDLKVLEGRWRDKLQSWAPLGLNTKDD